MSTISESNRRLENLLVMILLQSLKGASIKEKAIKINKAGFSNVEIADFLGTTNQVVANAISEGKKKKPTKKKSTRNTE